ncbi:glycosyltransferase family 2 protein [Halomonas sp. 18H]|uniref:glycosyltransferase family 2 protein n=1 Tax=Halomonas almeriensis TaxID=308163 RepID=UPI00222F04D6|nr:MULTISPECIES: glycosyltransferase family 2 protein [Halomonas]MCW4151728.1 glycosyltransferase family 2 protein [Halomonas sp. 18H]
MARLNNQDVLARLKPTLLKIKSWSITKGVSRWFSEVAGLRWAPELSVKCDIEPCTPNDDDLQWEAITENGEFFLVGGNPRSGWHMLEVVMEHDQPHAALRINFDKEGQPEKEHSIFLPLKKGKMTKRLCFIPFGVTRIRLDPMETTGRFSIRELRFVWLMPGFAYDRLALRLHNLHTAYKDRPKKDILRLVRKEAKEGGRHWRKIAVSHYEETFMHCAPSRHYQYWLDHVEPKRLVSPNQVVANLGRMPKKHKHLISILLPTYNTPVEWLKAAIESVMAQSYPSWQLCIADDASNDEETLSALARWADSDDRIDVVYRQKNEGVAAASNSALDMARGDFVAWLGHDDEMAPNALYHVVETLGRHPDGELLYSDEDKIDEVSQRFDPYFKPRWNPDLLLARNYIAHLSVLRTGRLRNIGGFRRGFEGGHNHDVLLRFTHDLPESRIHHIPFILYHWRSVSHVSSSSDEKPSNAGLRAVRDHVARLSPQARVVAGPVAESYRVIWPVPDTEPMVSLLVPTRDGIEILRPCVNAILETTQYENFEVLILDNQSQCQETLAYMSDLEKRDSRVRVIRWDYPFNYSSINNFGVRHARGDIIGLVNNDIEPINGNWLREMVSHVARPDVGCVGAKLYYPNDTIQHAGVILGLGGVAGHSHKFYAKHHPGYFHRLYLVQNLSAVTAACLLIRKSVFESVGGLNETDLAVAFNDVDLCLKVREAGYRNVWTPHAELYHHESVSRGADDSPKKHARFKREIAYMRRTWGPQLDSDPAYNPNLTLAYEDFSLR